MGELILKTDDGPDFKVDTENLVGSAEIVCGRLGKVVGRVAIYTGGPNLLVYITDRRKPLGSNRVAYLCGRKDAPADILAKCGGGAALKEALRRAGLVDQAVMVSAESAVIE